MYRACSTWQYEVVSHLVEEHLEGERLGYMTSEQYAVHLKAREIEESNAAESPSRRWCVIKSHDRDPSFARAMFDQRAIAVYAYRDVREVVFSLMHKRGVTFEQLLRQGMLHQVLANDRFWMGQPDVLAQRYEDLLAEPARGVAELARHLGIRIDADEAARIAEFYSHESNRARTEALKRRLEEAGLDLESAANAQICDSSTLLHWNHIRSRDSKSWQALATPRQRAVFRRLLGRWLNARGYPADREQAEVPALSLLERISFEADLLVGFATFLIRALTVQFPGSARALKRLLGMAVDAQGGATAWADQVPAQSRVKRSGGPHIALTKPSTQSEAKAAVNEAALPN
jgi:hypothetical protein